MRDEEFRTTEDMAVGEMIARDGFARASLAYAAAMVDLHSADWVLNRVINDRGRMAAALAMLDLHFQGNQTGFAITDLREQALIHGFASPNRVTALVGALRVAGFLRPVEATDQRLKKVAPTELFVALFRRLLTLQLQAQVLVRPEIGGAVAALADPSILGVFLHVELVVVRRAALAGHETATQALAERANAMVMLYAVFVAEAAGALLPISELARRFAVARSHVLSVLKDAEAHGLMMLDPAARNFRPTARLEQVLYRLFARIFLSQAGAYDIALLPRDGTALVSG
ncbi:MAG: hypothetical protein HIU92_08640 [Proteobacteria bacterium]|nr:hypothetical protein [Pseudomonadota bacterium]